MRWSFWRSILRSILTALASELNATGLTTMSETDARRIVTTALAQLREQGQMSGQPEPLAVLEVLASHHTLMRSGANFKSCAMWLIIWARCSEIFGRSQISVTSRCTSSPPLPRSNS